MSKVAVVRLTEQVAADHADVRANAIAPGFVATEMHESTLAAGEQLAGENFARTEEQLEEGAVPAERAAALAALLLGPRGRGITGKLISAQWDPWEDPEFLARLAADPDLGTLRRIDGVQYRSS
jgi:3-oxoacyl-[acyl-carrier protein] reductase